MSKLTPLMEQYYRIKEQHPGTLLFYRMGDFYEMFGEDAKIAAEVLGIQLTARNQGGGDPTPLAGVPYHAGERYLRRLLEAGYKVAVCEQMEDPKKTKTLVKRDVVEVLTPGSITVDGMLADKENLYAAAIIPTERLYGLAWMDVSTGEFTTAALDRTQVEQLLLTIRPRELLLPEPDAALGRELAAMAEPAPALTLSGDWKTDLAHCRQTLLDHFGVQSLEGFGLFAPEAVRAAGMLLGYMLELKKNHLNHVRRLAPLGEEGYLVLDPYTQRNLELVRSLEDGSTANTLFEVLDRTATSMGARALRIAILRPLRDPERIGRRQETVAWLLRGDTCERLRTLLRKIGDMERAAGKLGSGKSGPRDLVALATALETIPDIATLLTDDELPALAASIRQNLGDTAPLAAEIRRTLVDDPPPTLADGGVIRPGRSPALDDYRSLAHDAKSLIAAMQQDERQATGIPNLKIGYNSVFGYYIEVTNSHKALVPPHYIRKQTLAGCERFITPDLKEFEDRVLGAEEKAQEIELGLFTELRGLIAEHAAELVRIAQTLALLDLLNSLAMVARAGRWTRPVLAEKPGLRIIGGRHPVVESLIGEARFVPNDCILDPDTNQVAVITGPNMSGKSTYIRQVGLIVLMAHLGSYVPAAEAEIGPCDRIFTRVGATDRLARGQSTFLVEMIETANILNNATRQSLILLDEVGRGTSTFDGLSIAWAVCEYLHNRIGAATLFATHYHELTEMATLYPRIANYQVAVKEYNEQVVFLHRIVPGGCDDSYGIYVAQLAGVPAELINRARVILGALEVEATVSERLKEAEQGPVAVQLSIFEPSFHPLVKALQGTTPDALTPLQALELLNDWKKRWG